MTNVGDDSLAYGVNPIRVRQEGYVHYLMVVVATAPQSKCCHGVVPGLEAIRVLPSRPRPVPPLVGVPPPLPRPPPLPPPRPLPRPDPRPRPPGLLVRGVVAAAVVVIDGGDERVVIHDI